MSTLSPQQFADYGSIFLPQHQLQQWFLLLSCDSLCPPVCFQFRGSSLPRDLSSALTLEELLISGLFSQLPAVGTEGQLPTSPIRHAVLAPFHEMPSLCPALTWVSCSSSWGPLRVQKGGCHRLHFTDKGKQGRGWVTRLLEVKVCQSPRVPTADHMLPPLILTTPHPHNPLVGGHAQPPRRPPRRLCKNSICTWGEGLSRRP